MANTVATASPYRVTAAAAVVPVRIPARYSRDM